MEPEQEGKPLHFYVTWLFGRFDLLWARRKFIGAMGLSGALLLLAVALLTSNRYTATAYVLPPDANPMNGLQLMLGARSGSLGGSAAGQLSDVLGGKSQGQLYVRQMTSRPVEDQLIQKFDLKNVYGTKLQGQTRKALESHVLIDEDHKTGVISVAVTDTDPKRAAAMANAVPDELGRLLADISSTAGRREREYFEGQLVIAREDLDKNSRALSEFSKKNSALEIPAQGTAIVTSLGTIEGQLIAAQSELRELQQVYTDNHERVKQAKAKIAELQRQFDNISGKSDVNAKTGQNPAQGDLVSMSRVADLSTQYMSLVRKVKTSEALVETLSQQYAISKLQETRHIPEVQVFDPAVPPEKKSGPHRLIMTFAGGVVFVLLGCAIILVGDWWSHLEEENELKLAFAPILSRAKQSAPFRRGGSKQGSTVTSESESQSLSPVGKEQ